MMRETCPDCGGPNCTAETVDIGVGEQQCTPFVCEDCGYVQPYGPEILDDESND